VREVLDRHRLPTRPVVGLTLCYSYLWYREFRQSHRVEGLKYRPCVIVLSYESIKGVPGRFVADVAPVSHGGKTTMAPQLFSRQIEDGAWAITLATPQQIQPLDVLDINEREERARWRVYAH